MLNSMKSKSRECCSVAVVGAGMTGLPGIMARVANVLAEEDIDIYQITDSHHNISCIIAHEQQEQAIKGLHRAFRLGES